MFGTLLHEHSEPASYSFHSFSIFLTLSEWGILLRCVCSQRKYKSNGKSDESINLKFSFGTKRRCEEKKKFFFKESNLEHQKNLYEHDNRKAVSETQQRGMYQNIADLHMNINHNISRKPFAQNVLLYASWQCHTQKQKPIRKHLLTSLETSSCE